MTPDLVLGESRKGLKVAYCTDTRPVPVIAEYAKGADLMICEGMYGEPEKASKASDAKLILFCRLARQGAEDGGRAQQSAGAEKQLNQIGHGIGDVVQPEIRLGVLVNRQH